MSRDQSSPKIFQIGFNKCGTSSLFKLFQDSGVPSIHSNGRLHRRSGHPAFQGKPLHVIVDDNISKGRRPFDGFEDFQAFFDMEFTKKAKIISNYLKFDVIAAAYPDALFILNLRDKEDWLRSRLRHGDGKYIKLWMKFTGLEMEQILQSWSDGFDEHHQNVRFFFASQPSRLLEFNIDSSDIQELVDFVAPEIKLDKSKWQQHRRTDAVVKNKSWTDEYSDFSLKEFL